jgi:hypothetical protein
VPTSGLAFFSDRKINSLVERLGSDEIRHLVYQIDDAIKMRLLARSSSDTFAANLSRHQTVEPLPPADVKTYVNSWSICPVH